MRAPAGQRGIPTRVQDITDLLVDLGIEREEAAVYVHLSMQGPLKASEVAEGLKLPRNKAYRILDSLTERGHVLASVEKPTVFEAAPPQKLFDDLFAKQEAQWEAIVRAKAQVAAALLTLRAEPAQKGDRPHFKTVQGRAQILRLKEQMLSNAKKEIVVIHTHRADEQFPPLGDLLELAIRRAKQGVRVRLLWTLGNEARRIVSKFGGVPGFEIRHLETETPVWGTITDHQDLLMWLVVDRTSRLGTDRDAALWLTAPDFVGAQTVLFDASWERGTPVPGKPGS